MEKKSEKESSLEVINDNSFLLLITVPPVAGRFDISVRIVPFPVIGLASAGYTPEDKNVRLLIARLSLSKLIDAKCLGVLRQGDEHLLVIS